MQTLKIKGLDIQVGEAALEALVLERLLGVEPAKTTTLVAPGTLPRIGAEIVELGGVFAGVARGLNGEPDYYLIAGPEAPQKFAWQAATDWADGIKQQGFSDFELPRRAEQALLYANVPELFQKEWYWSQEQHAGSSGYAWIQFFNYGNQDNGRKDDGNRARAVRRSPIQ